jgi:hypothetical protein
MVAEYTLSAPFRTTIDDAVDAVERPENEMVVSGVAPIVLYATSAYVVFADELVMVVHPALEIAGSEPSAPTITIMISPVALVPNVSVPVVATPKLADAVEITDGAVPAGTVIPVM